MFSMLAILVCCFGLILSFQNCGGDFGLIDNLEAPATLAPAAPLELSSDVTQVQMKLNSNDEMILPEENIGVDVNLEKQNMQITDSKASELFKLNRSEVNEIRVLLRLIRKIHLSAEKCKRPLNNGAPVPLTMVDDLKPEPIIVNTSDEQNIVLGKYVNCKTRYDLAKEERRILKRILLRLILKRTVVNCPVDPNIQNDEPICEPGSYLVRKIDSRFCNDGYKCVKKPKQCFNKALILPPHCPPNSKRVKVYNNGCLTGYRCDVSHHQCPLLPQIAIRCEPGFKAVQVFDKNKCVIGQRCQKLNECPVFAQSPEQHGAQKACLANGGKYLPVKNSAGCVVAYKCHRKMACPVNIRSPFDYNDKKQCLSNGGKYIPIRNKNDCITSYNCIGGCPETQNYEGRRPANWEADCENSGGTVISSDIINGCKRPPYCKKPNSCPNVYSKDESKKCFARGGSYQANSKSGNCVTEYHCKMAPCPAFIPEPDFKSSCISSGGKIVYPKPVNNCPIPPICERPKMCTMEMPIPSEAMLKRCNITGGKLVLKKDRNGCPTRYICEGSKELCPEVSPSYLMVQKCQKTGGNLKLIKNSNQCTVGFRCDKDKICPEIDYVLPNCKPGERTQPVISSDGCDLGNECVPENPIVCPPVAFPYPVCKSSHTVKQKVDNMGCLTGYRCEPKPGVCPPVLAIPPHCTNGLETIISENGCHTGYRCKQPVSCPRIAPPEPGFCGDEEKIEQVTDRNGCVTGFKCTDPLVVCTAEIPKKPYCGDNAIAQIRKGNNGCFTGWACQPKLDEPHMCPMLPLALPMCMPPSQLKVIKDGNNCTVGYKCINGGGSVGGTTPPNNCTSWFDGCNTCSASNGKVGGCTEKACFVMEEPRCLKY